MKNQNATMSCIEYFLFSLGNSLKEILEVKIL